MNAESSTTFAADILSTWIDTDAEQRHRSIERIWAPDGRLVISSLGITVDGTAAIAAHIDRVHDDLITSKGLRLSYDQEVDADDALLLRWSMTAPSGDVVGRGADLVFRDDDGRVTTVYMFMGVN